METEETKHIGIGITDPAKMFVVGFGAEAIFEVSDEGEMKVLGREVTLKEFNEILIEGYRSVFEGLPLFRFKSDGKVGSTPPNHEYEVSDG